MNLPSRVAALASCLLALSLVGPASVAQTAPFVPGYVVTEADTLRGEVAIGSETVASRGLSFRMLGGAARDIGVTGASAFGTDDGRGYRRATFALTAVPEDNAVTPGQRLGFGRVVRDGAADLLAFETVPGRPSFHVDLGGGPVGLFVVNDVVPTASGRRSRERPLFRQTLLTLLGSCGVAPEMVATLAYDEADIADVIDTYNRCRDDAYAPLADASAPRRARAQVAFEADLGLTRGTFEREFARTFTSGYTDPDLSSVAARAAAVVTLPTTTELVSYVVEAQYAHSVADFATEVLFDSFSEDRISTLHLGLGVRANASVAGSRIYVGIGALTGTVFRSRVADGIEDLDGLLQFVPGQSSMNSSGGRYLEAGVQPLGLPVFASVRSQSTTFSSTAIYVPGTPSGASHSVQTTTLSLGARF